MYISLWIGYQRLMETLSLFHTIQTAKIYICTFSINADMQFRQNNKRFNWTSYLYYTHFLINIYWHFIQKMKKIPKTYTFWGLKSVSDISSAYLLHSFKPLFSGIFKAFVYYLFITGKVSYAPLLFYYTSESWFL